MFRDLLPANESAPLYLMLFDTDGNSFRCDPAEEPHLDAVYSRFLESGRTRDELIELGLQGSGRVKIAIGSVSSWIVHTTESMIMTHKLERALEDRIREEILDFESES